MQLSFDILIHPKENNALSQAYLEAHREHFAHDTFMVLCELVNGRRLNYKIALMEGLTGDLRRRSKDLRDMGIPVSSEWITTGNGRKYKDYFMTDSDKSQALKIIVERLKKAA